MTEATAFDPQWIADRVFTAADIATDELWFADPEEEPKTVIDAMRVQAFEVAPLREDPVHRYVELAALEKTGLPSITSVARPITPEVLMPAATGLLSTIQALERTPFTFLMDRRGVDSIVTRADLQRAPVAIAALSLIFIAERALTGIVEATYGDAWTDHLSGDRVRMTKEVFEDRIRLDAEISLLECLMLDDLLTLARKDSDLRERLGYSGRKSFSAWKERLGDVRNTLAHAGDLLSAEPDPIDAIDLFREIMRFATSASTLHRGLSDG
jgi:hypothetical protein